MIGTTASAAEGSRRPVPWRALGIAALVFGVVTVLSGGKVLFGGAEARAGAGSVVDFVLWFNFVAGFAYVAAGVGISARRSWALPVARFLAVATLLTFAGLGVHMGLGGAFETRTVAAMTLRSAFWIGQSMILAQFLRTAAARPSVPEG